MHAHADDETFANLQDAIREVREAKTDEEAAHCGRTLATAAERFLETTLIVEPFRA